jgi:16S rRNA (uracil1498-N3)-methyltransferase
MRSPEHHIFFAHSVTGNRLLISADEHRHLVSVLRTAVGDRFQATDGRGRVYSCALTAAGKKGNNSEAEVISRETRPAVVPAVTLYVGMPEREGFEQALDAAAVLGVRRVVPLVCEYSQDRWWSDAWEKYADRFSRKLIAGLKQSLGAWMPELSQPVLFADGLAAAGNALVVADGEGLSPGDALPKLAAQNRIDCFVGPPGGFSPQELQALTERRAIAVRLSANRLRTELAAELLCGLVLAR